MPQISRPILIVEDDRNIAGLVETYLTRAGFETVVARDGLAGLELARQRDPQFVILDLMLPGLDGWEICRELRRSSDVPILISPKSDRIIVHGTDIEHRAFRARGLDHESVRFRFHDDRRFLGFDFRHRLSGFHGVAR